MADAQWRYVSGISAGHSPGGANYYIARKLEEPVEGREPRVLATNLVTEPLTREQMEHLYKQIGAVLGFGPVGD